MHKVKINGSAVQLAALHGTEERGPLRTSDGHRVAVLAVEHGGEWWFMWGKNDQVAADRPDLAARFLSGANAQVLDLMARRPQPWGAGAHLSAVA